MGFRDNHFRRFYLLWLGVDEMIIQIDRLVFNFYIVDTFRFYEYRVEKHDSQDLFSFQFGYVLITWRKIMAQK